MQRAIKVNLKGRFLISRVMGAFRTENRKQNMEACDLFDLFVPTPEEEEDLNIRHLSVTEKLALGIPAHLDRVSWPPEIEDRSWTRELSDSQSDMLKFALDNFGGYERTDRIQNDIVAQIEKKQTREQLEAEV